MHLTLTWVTASCALAVAFGALSTSSTAILSRLTGNVPAVAPEPGSDGTPDNPCHVGLYIGDSVIVQVAF